MRGRFGKNEWKVKLFTVLGIVLALILISGVGFLAYKVIKPKYEEYQEAKRIEKAMEESMEEANTEQDNLEEDTGVSEDLYEVSATPEPMEYVSLGDYEQYQDNDSNDGDYFFPDSGSRYLSYSDVEGMNIQQINYAKNEIYARRGRKFKSTELQNYFNSKSWYNGIIEPDDFKESMLNKYEKANAEYLLSIEHSMDPNGYRPR